MDWQVLVWILLVVAVVAVVLLAKALGQAREQVARLETSLELERSGAQEKMTLLQEAKDQLRQQFQVLAQDILEEKSKRFSEQNQTALGQILEPLRARIQEFQGKVETAYVNDSKDRSALAEQVKNLVSMNQQLSERASDLTRALTSQNKAQGNWGELILERVLETSGLRKGLEYSVQESHQREDGSRVQPDVVLHLPEQRHLIIDAKMSLNAYMDYVNAADDLVREGARKRHIDSVRAHIKGLAEKNYQDLYGSGSPDFVLMFVPVESAFMLAITEDSALWQDAWQRNVLLVSPSTLLFVVRTVAQLWRQEQQTRNAQEIAKRGAALYDKFVGFVSDMDSLGQRLQQANKAYDDSVKKLSSGNGSLVRQAEMLKELGIKPSKRVPDHHLPEADDLLERE
jgi:DNA recombination protein RmuC